MTLTVTAAVMRFDGILALDGVSLEANPGTVTGILGPNGAGKTTLFNAITGDCRLDAGEVRIDSQRIDRLPPWRVSRLGVGRLFQEVRLFGSVSVLDNVLTAADLARKCGRLSARRSANMARRETAHRALELVGLADQANQRASELSFGQQKLLAFARLFAGRFPIILLDEPLAGVASSLVASLLGLVRALARQGTTVIVIEHAIASLEEVSDALVVLVKGRVVARGDPSSVLGDPTVRSLLLGGRP